MTIRALFDPEIIALEAALTELWDRRELRSAERSALRTLLHTGLRISELTALLPVHYQEGRLWVADSKTEKSRTVVVPLSIRPMLERRIAKAASPCTPIFPVHQRTLRRRLAAACRVAGIAHARLHDLRHTRVSVLIRAMRDGGLTASHQAGHASVGFTVERYGHLSPLSEQEEARLAAV
jgi:integrase